MADAMAELERPQMTMRWQNSVWSVRTSHRRLCPYVRRCTEPYVARSLAHFPLSRRTHFSTAALWVEYCRRIARMDLLEGVCAACGREGLGLEAKRCSRCKSATYCSVDCQKTDWGGHKKICKVLNAGRARLLRHPDHLGAVGIPGQMISGLSGMDDDCREIFRLFRATKPDAETRRAMMRQIADGMSMSNRESLFFQSIGILLGLDSDVIVQSTSPVLVLLESGVDPNALSHPFGSPPDDTSSRPLHLLVSLTAPDVDVMERQAIIAKQLIDAGADVNAVNASGLGKNSPLHNACFSGRCTNLELIKLFLDHGADPNLGNCVGQTSLMMTLEMSPSAAKLLLTYPYETSPAPAIDVNVRADDGSLFLGGLQDAIDRTKGALARLSVGLPTMKQMDWNHPAQFQYHINQMEEVKILAENLGGVGAAEGWKSPRETYTAEDLRRMDASSFPTIHHGPPLPYDVKCLLGKELLFGVCGHPDGDQGDSPDWYRYHPFYVCDSENKQFAVLKKKQYLHTGKVPKVGLRVEIKVMIPADSCADISADIAPLIDKDWHWGRLQGKITEVCTQPTEAQLASSDSQFYKRPCLCDNPDCSSTKTGETSEIIEKHGDVHGQEVKGIVSLSEEYTNHVHLMAFFRGNETRYSVTLRMNDHKLNKWELCQISEYEK